MSFLWGLSPHIAKFAIQESPLPYIAIRQISAALIGTGLMGILVVSHFINPKKMVKRGSNKVIGLSVLAGAISAVSIAICTWLIFTIKIPSVVNGLTYPLGLSATVLLGLLFKNENMSIQQVCGIVLSVFASYLLCQQKK